MHCFMSLIQRIDNPALRTFNYRKKDKYNDDGAYIRKI